MQSKYLIKLMGDKIMKNLVAKFWKVSLFTVLICATAGFCNNAVADEKTDSLIKDALSAAPSSLSKEVTVVDWEGNVLRKGSGIYTCFPTPPQLQGKAPMCFDKPWKAWADGWMNKKDFKVSTIGISYMLAGDEGASNVDPYAKGATKDNQWVKEGPHLMIIVPDKSLLSDLSTDPHNGGPYVMWKGTPYEHIMIPVAR